jgi:hypothetical protein
LHDDGDRAKSKAPALEAGASLLHAAHVQACALSLAGSNVSFLQNWKGLAARPLEVEGKRCLHNFSGSQARSVGEMVTRQCELLVSGVIFGAVVVSSGASRAQEMPNVVGTWKGTAQAVHVGDNPYRSTEGSGPSFSESSIEFTFTITDQRGNRFSGHSSGGKRAETLIGAISPSNRSGIVVDDDGQYLFTVRDRDTLDVCYSHLNLSGKVASCYEWKRSK